MLQKNRKQDMTGQQCGQAEIIIGFDYKYSFQIKMGNKVESICCTDTPINTLLQQIQDQVDLQKMISISQSVEVTCDICSLEMDQKFVLPCEHFYHKPCISQYLKARINTKSLKMPCPSGCGLEMGQEVLKQILEKQDFRMYERSLLENLVETDKDYSFCCTPDCQAVFKISECIEQLYSCKLCLKTYCLACRKEGHVSKDCNFKEEQASVTAMTQAGMKPCPNCQRMIEKDGGCCSVMCRCGKQFCYTCGGASCPHGICLIYPQKSVAIQGLDFDQIRQWMIRRRIHQIQDQQQWLDA